MGAGCSLRPDISRARGSGAGQVVVLGLVQTPLSLLCRWKLQHLLEPTSNLSGVLGEGCGGAVN